MEARDLAVTENLCSAIQSSHLFHNVNMPLNNLEMESNTETNVDINIESSLTVSPIGTIASLLDEMNSIPLPNAESDIESLSSLHPM